MRIVLQAILITLFVTTQPVNAQVAGPELAGQELPDLKGLRNLFGDVASGKTEVVEIRESDGLLGSGIKVPDTGARGTMASAISNLIGQEVDNPEITQVLEKAFIDASDAVEDALPQLGFQKRDYGVSFALFFILSWELANKATLELEASKAAGGNILKTVQAAGEGQNATPEELDIGYDMFLTIPVALLTLVQAYEQEGQMAEAAQMRELAASTFEQIVGLSPYDIDITASGEIIGY